MILTAQDPPSLRAGRVPRNGNVPAVFPPIDLAKTINTLGHFRQAHARGAAATDRDLWRLKRRFLVPTCSRASSRWRLNLRNPRPRLVCDPWLIRLDHRQPFRQVIPSPPQRRDSVLCPPRRLPGRRLWPSRQFRFRWATRACSVASCASIALLPRGSPRWRLRYARWRSALVWAMGGSVTRDETTDLEGQGRLLVRHGHVCATGWRDQ